jgi:hypothetical protein
MTEAKIAVANAPCSWGATDDFPPDGSALGYAQVLDEMALAGYAGTELGDWGFLPTDPPTLRAELSRRNLALVGAFVPVRLSDPGAHAAGEELAVRTASLLAEGANGQGVPCLVLADDVNPARISVAGRVTPEHALTDDQWRIVAQGAGRIARAVRERTGLRTAFHHHAGTYVETPHEVATLMERTDPATRSMPCAASPTASGTSTRKTATVMFSPTPESTVGITSGPCAAGSSASWAGASSTCRRSSPSSCSAATAAGSSSRTR